MSPPQENCFPRCSRKTDAGANAGRISRLNGTHYTNMAHVEVAAYTIAAPAGSCTAAQSVPDRRI
jgi:hypothetical protein